MGDIMKYMSAMMMAIMGIAVISMVIGAAKTADLAIEAVDEFGNPVAEAAIALNGLVGQTGPGGTLSITGLSTGSYNGSCTKAGYSVVSVFLDGASIPVSDGNF